MADVSPFVSIDDFVTMFRPLTAGERALATKMLAAASAWVRDNTSRTPPDNTAELVVFDVVKSAMPSVAGNGQNLAGRTQYMLQTDDRMESATLSEAADLLDFTDHHRELLGLSTVALPTGDGFGDFGRHW